MLSNKANLVLESLSPSQEGRSQEDQKATHYVAGEIRITQEVAGHTFVIKFQVNFFQENPIFTDYRCDYTGKHTFK